MSVLALWITRHDVHELIVNSSKFLRFWFLSFITPFATLQNCRYCLVKNKLPNLLKLMKQNSPQSCTDRIRAPCIEPSSNLIDQPPHISREMISNHCNLSRSWTKNIHSSDSSWMWSYNNYASEENMKTYPSAAHRLARISYSTIIACQELISSKFTILGSCNPWMLNDII